MEDQTGIARVKHESDEEKNSNDEELMKEDLLPELEKLRNLVKSAKQSLNLLTQIYQQSKGVKKV